MYHGNRYLKGLSEYQSYELSISLLIKSINININVKYLAIHLNLFPLNICPATIAHFIIASWFISHYFRVRKFNKK